MEQLKRKLKSIEENDTNYGKRYTLVISAMHYAGELGYPNYIRFDPEAPGWPVFCIMLPGAGEVSWHMPSTQKEYTGYTNEEKYARIHKWVNFDFGKKYVPYA
jgi:hypothetical protein